MLFKHYEGDEDPVPGQIIYSEPTKLTEYPRMRAQRCISCDEPVGELDEVAVWRRQKVVETAVQRRIYGEGGLMPRANHYMCADCGHAYFELRQAGMCADIGDNMQKMLNEFEKSPKDWV